MTMLLMLPAAVLAAVGWNSAFSDDLDAAAAWFLVSLVAYLIGGDLLIIHNRSKA